MHTVLAFVLARYPNFRFVVGHEPVDCIVPWCPQHKRLVPWCPQHKRLVLKPSKIYFVKTPPLDRTVPGGRTIDPYLSFEGSKQVINNM